MYRWHSWNNEKGEETHRVFFSKRFSVFLGFFECFDMRRPHEGGCFEGLMKVINMVVEMDCRTEGLEVGSMGEVWSWRWWRMVFDERFRDIHLIFNSNSKRQKPNYNLIIK